MKFLRVLNFLRILQIDLDPPKLVPAEKNTRKIKRRKNNKTPFSQIKNFALNRLMPLDLLNMIFHWKKQLELLRVKQIQYIRLARMGQLKEPTDSNRAAGNHVLVPGFWWSFCGGLSPRGGGGGHLTHVWV